jgi:hypothetical protein
MSSVGDAGSAAVLEVLLEENPERKIALLPTPQGRMGPPADLKMGPSPVKQPNGSMSQTRKLTDRSGGAVHFPPACW